MLLLRLGLNVLERINMKKITCKCGKKLDPRGAHKHFQICSSYKVGPGTKLHTYSGLIDEIVSKQANSKPWEDIPNFTPSTETVEIVQRFEKATRDHEMMGSKEPEYHNEIQDEYDIAKAQLYLHIIKLDEQICL
jgi:hypothetical protein